MRVTSRTIVVPLFGLALAAVTACGSKPAPTSEPDVTLQPEPGPSPETALPVHEMDSAKHAIPARPVIGTVAGTPATPGAAIEGESLIFRVQRASEEKPNREIQIRLRTKPGQPLPEGKRTVSRELPPGPEVPEVMMLTPGRDPQLFPNGYAMTLELAPRKAGKVAGKVYLSLPDDEKTVLAGTFVADAPRHPTEPPGVEDVPLVNGSVTVSGAAPDAVLMTGYAAKPSADSYQFGWVDIQLGGPIDPPRAAWREDGPRVTSLIAGDGKAVPSRYEHSRLVPGRYLVFAGLKNGPAAWKWVDVKEKSTVAADLTIDAGKTGGVEVTAPLGALGKVQLAPADDPTRPPLDADLVALLALQLKLEQDIVARKALFKNLAPGRYEVRVPGEVRVVEVVAGKTMELDFDAKKK